MSLEQTTRNALTFRIAPIEGCDDTIPVKTLTDAQVQRIAEIADYEAQGFVSRARFDVEVVGADETGMVWLSIETMVYCNDVIYVWPDGSFEAESGVTHRYCPADAWAEYMDDCNEAAAEAAYERSFDG